MTYIQQGETWATTRSKINQVIKVSYTDLLADTELTYTGGESGTVTAGDLYPTTEGNWFEVAASDAVDQHITTAGGVKLYEAGPSFSLRSRLVAAHARNVAAGRTVPVGVVWTWPDFSIVLMPAGHVAYGTDPIADLAGWAPSGDVYVDHFGENTTPGSTDMRAAFLASCDYCISAGSDLNFSPRRAMHFVHNGSPITPSASGPLTIRGNRAPITMAVTDNTYRPFMNNGFGRLVLKDVIYTFPDEAGGQGPFLQAASDFWFYDCEFYGLVTDTGGGSAYRISYPVQQFSADLDRIGFERCVFDKVTNLFLKSNSDTEKTDGVWVLDCEKRDVWLNGGLNSPSGDCYQVNERGTRVINTTSAGNILGVSGASVRLGVFSDITFRGPINYCFHFEEESEDISISNVGAQVDGGFFRLLQNSVGGSAGQPARVQLANFSAKHTGTATSGQFGINLIIDANKPPATDVRITNGNLYGFYDAIVVGAYSHNNINISDVTVDSPVRYGLQFDQGVPPGVKNISFRNCPTAVYMARGGGILDGFSFYNCTNVLNLNAGPAIIKDPTFVFDDQTLPATSSLFLRLLDGFDRCDIACYGSAYRENWADTSAAFRVQWDGSTATETDLGTIDDTPLSSEFLIIREAVSATVSAAGTGYSINDVLTVSGGTLATNGTAATFLVTSVGGSGEVTGISLQNAGEYTALAGNPASTTGGGGSGCTLTVTYQAVLAYRIGNSAISASAKVHVSTDGVVNFNAVA